MENRYRSYPYPVLTFYGDDYVDSAFATDISMHSNGYDLVFEINTTIQNKELAQLVANGKAVIIYVFECSQTGYRECKESDKTKSVFSIKELLLNGVLTVFPFIVARENIKGYSNSHFNEDYEGASFDIEKGKFLAVGQSTQVEIKKKDSDMLKTSSIFTIIPNNESADDIQVDTIRNHIVIKLARKDYDRCWPLFGNPGLKDLLNSAIVVPSLQSILNRLSAMGEEQCETEYGDAGWYNSIKDVLQSRFGKSISDINTDNSFSLAQKMLKTPIGSALENLVALKDRSIEEVEE